MDKRPKSMASSRGVHSRESERAKVNLLNSVQFQNPNLRQLNKVFKKMHISAEQNKSSQGKRNEKQKVKETKDDVKNSLQSQVKGNLKDQNSIPQIDLKKVEQPQIEVRRLKLDSQTQRNKHLEENLLQKIQNRKILEQFNAKSAKNQNQLQTAEFKQPQEKLEQKENQENLDKEQVPCILDQEDFPIIPEVHHLTGRCYCDYCTCGNHFCPSITIRGLYGQSTFRTQYQNFYQGKKQNYPLLKTDREKYVRIDMPSDYRTIKQQDYDNIIEKLRKSAESGFQFSKSPNSSELKKGFESKFLATTSNQHFYPNWGPRSQEFFKRPNLPVRQMNNTEMKSTYSNFFRNPNTQQNFNSTIFRSEQTEDRPGLNTRMSNRSDMSNLPYASLGNLPFNSRTTVQVEFSNKSKTQESPFSIKKQEQAQKTYFNPRMFVTTVHEMQHSNSNINNHKLRKFRLLQ